MKPSIVIYESNDNESISGNCHHKPFYEFISAIGFPAVPKYESSYDKMVIDGIQLVVEFDSASFYGFNAFNRERKPRKNRYIDIRRYRGEKKLVCRIPLNKEIDKNIIIQKIEEGIKAEKAIDQEITDRETRRNIMLTKMRLHYLGCEKIAKYVFALTLEKGKICFAIKNIGWLYVDAKDNTFLLYSPSIPEKMDQPATFKWMDTVGKSQKIITQIVEALNEIGHLDSDFYEYAKEEYRGSVNKKEIEKY